MDADFQEEALPHLDALYRYALRLTRNDKDAEDLLQDTFLRAYRFWEKYKKGSNCKAWLFRIMKNQFLNRIDKSKRMVYTPDVTVRMRGVMEKCSYCVQRIKRNTIEAKNLWARGERDKPTVDDGAIVTACQQSCPTQAIVFGDLNDANSDVTKSQQSPRAYMVLEELNTRARSKYLAKLRNPNPALASTNGGGHEPSHPASETQGAHS